MTGGMNGHASHGRAAVGQQVLEGDLVSIAFNLPGGLTGLPYPRPPGAPAGMISSYARKVLRSNLLSEISKECLKGLVTHKIGQDNAAW